MGSEELQKVFGEVLWQKKSFENYFYPCEVFDSMSLNIFPSVRQVILSWVSHVPVTTLVSSNLLSPDGTYKHNRFS